MERPPIEPRYRAIGAVSLTLGGLIVFIYSACSIIITQQQARIERLDTDQHLQRVQLILSDRGAQFHQALIDYARWDDTWNYLDGTNPDYPTEAITEDSLAALGAEALHIARFDGALYTEQDPDALIDSATWARWRAQLGEHRGSVWAIEAGTVWMLSSEPVAHNDGTGPILGSALSARRFGPAITAQLGALTGTHIQLSPAGTAPGERVTLADHMRVSVRVPTLTEDMRLEVQAPRPLVALTRTTHLTLLIATVVGGFAITFGTVWGLDRKVFAPIARLRSEILAIQAGSRTPQHLTVPPVQSIRPLVEAFNALLSEQARQHQALQDARQAAEAAVVARTRFLATMSHEIRTPMHAVLGTTELLHRTPLPPDVATLIAEQRAAATALMAVLNDVLDFAKIEANHLDLDEQPYDLVPLLQETTMAFASMAIERRLVLGIASLPNTLPLRGDAARTRQILMNLISNALKFTPPGGQVQISLDAASSSRWLEIHIEDSGPGIPPERLSTIFEPFTQGDSTYTRRAGGTGLGLTISRQLAEAMGGRLTVQSTQGEGSTFTLRLPHHPASLAAPGEDLSQDAALRVLLAEDNTINQRITRLLLEQEGHTVQVVANGLEAVAAALQQPFDVILMDLQMPECDGIEATRRLRAAGSTVYIVAFSANTSSEDRLACAAAGMQDNLAKPVDRQALRRVLRSACAPEAITAVSG